MPVRQEAMGEQGCRGSTDTLEGVEAGETSAREVAIVGGGVSGSAGAASLARSTWSTAITS